MIRFGVFILVGGTLIAATAQGAFYYVNDASALNDVYCTNPGNNFNDGTTPGTPKLTIQAIIDRYDLEPADVVYVDTGTYASASITLGSADAGSASGTVSFVGSTIPGGSLINFEYRYWRAIGLNNAPYIGFENLWIKGANVGIEVWDSDRCVISGCRVYANYYGIRVFESAYVTLDHNLVDFNTYTGVTIGGTDIDTSTSFFATMENNTVCHNGGNQIELNYGSLTLRNNIVWATAWEQHCVYELVKWGGGYGIAASNYNDLFATGGAFVGRSSSEVRATLSEWQAATGLDTNSISTDPVLLDRDGANNTPGDEDDDLHLASTSGSWHGGAFTPDAADSPCIDAGDPADPVNDEPTPNGGRINMGAYGGTYQASRTPATVPPPVITTDGGNGPGVDYATNDSGLVLQGTCHLNTTEIRVNGSTTGVTYAPGATTWSFSGTLVNGDNVFEVVAVDPSSVTTAPDTILIVLDTAQPFVMSATATNSTTVRVVFAEDMRNNADLTSAGFYDFLGGPVPVAASSATRVSATTVDLTVNEMANGASYTLMVGTNGPVDLAGNYLDPGGSSVNFTGVGVPPASPVITTNGGNNFTSNQSAVNLQGTCASDTAQILVNGASTGVTYTPESTAWSYSGSLGVGANVFSVVAVDDAGNASSADSITVTLDVTPPASPTITSNGGNDYATNQTPVSLQGTCAPDTNQIRVSGTTTGVTYAAGQTSWTYGGTLSEGANTFNVTALDAAGNESAPDTITITLDTAAPNAPVITTNGGADYLTNIAALTLQGACASDTAQIHVNGSTSGVTYTPGGTNWTYSATLSDGTNPYSVTARDAAGNESTADTITITLDRVKPRVQSATARSSTVVRVTYSEAMATAKILSPSYYTFSGSGTLLTASAVTDIDAATADVTVNAMTPGASYTVTVSTTGVTDLAGNTLDSTAKSANFTGFAEGLAPVAAFTANRTSGPPPLLVQFTDQSTNVPTAWSWDFDNNGSVDSTNQNPSFEYATPGVYSVKLTVSNGNGFDDETKLNYINVASGGTLPTRLLLSVTPRVVRQGDPIDIQGVFDSNPSSPPATLAGKPIRVRYLVAGVLNTEHTVNVDNARGYTDHFTPSQPGSWTVQAKFDGDSAFERSESTPSTVVVQAVAGYAILITGRISSNSGLSHHQLTISRVRQNLEATGFFPEHIIHFDPMIAVGDGFHEPLTKSGIQDKIKNWAGTQMRAAPAPLFIILVNHGEPNKFHVYSGTAGSAHDVLTPPDLDTWLDQLAVNLGNDGAGLAAKQKPVIIVDGSCYSGSFMDELSQLPDDQPRRIVVSSAAADEVSFKGPVEGYDANNRPIRDGELFVSQMFGALGLGKNLKVAFEETSELLRNYTGQPGQVSGVPGATSGKQHALLDDNSDGTGTNKLLPNPPPAEDGRLAASVRLGFGGEFNATQMTFDAASSTITLTAGGTEAPAISATLNNPGEELALVWVEVKPPDYTVNTPAQSEQVSLEGLLRISPDGGVKSTTGFSWSAQRMSIQSFAQPGRYDVTYFARNELGDFAPPAHTFVYRPPAGENAAPAPFGLLYPGNNVTISETAIFHWQPTEDPDGSYVTYTLELVPDLVGMPVIRIDGLESSFHAFPSPGDGYDRNDLRDGATYTWTVYAYDQYGARTPATESRQATVDTFGNPSLGTGNALLVLEDAINYRRITDATIMVGAWEVPHTGQGEYLLTDLSANGTFTFQVQSAAGYIVPQSTDLTIFDNTIVSRTLYLTPDCGTTVSSAEPASGPCDGANEVILSGSNFREGGTRVWFGDAEIPTSAIQFVSSNELQISQAPAADDAGATDDQPAVAITVETCGEPVVLEAGYLYSDVANCGQPADVNSDGGVNAVDVQVVINDALGLDTGYNSDINRDGNVNAVDVQLVINAALGLV
ncbi:MAG: PKD domain-containing protein [Candidatus Hydrogenedentes bacterium]|nr:PKD domain-containing protein [Candidatus Hydrogenedentota bacterium]